MYVLNKMDGNTNPEFRVWLLGTYDTLDEARSSMLRDMGAEVEKLNASGVLPMDEGEDYECKSYHMGAHVFLHERFWQWIIFDSDKPLEWNSMLSW